MLTCRPILRALRSSPSAAASAAASASARASERTKLGFVRTFSAPVAKKGADEEDGEDAVSPVTEAREKMSKYDRHMVFGQTGEHMPAPILPDDPKELAALDPADQRFRTKADGTARTVVIRQQKKSTRQAPLNPEASWRIYFYEDGIVSEKWSNSLMGWTSNADPYQFGNPLTFTNAAEAVYFAQKRGWNYTVKHPVMRYMRRDDAQYQDNFLPLAVAAEVQSKGTACGEWQRKSAGTSHYFRPLKYHGDGTVPQHGPNGTQPPEKHVAGYFKLR